MPSSRLRLDKVWIGGEPADIKMSAVAPRAICRANVCDPL